ncbi:MAG: sugar transferase [Ruminococcaceae bacterium]|nr:sugar transferase [Oscillospiraceae bacterium]
MYRSKETGWLKHYEFILLDAVWIVLSYIFATYVQPGSFALLHEELYRTLLVLYPLTHIFLVTFYGAYNDVLRRGYMVELKAALGHNTLIFLIVIMYMFLSRNSDSYSRMVVCLTLAVSSMLTYISRVVLKKVIVYRRKKHPRTNTHIFLLTDSALAESTVAAMLSASEPAVITGVILCDSDEASPGTQDIPIVANSSTWKDFLVANVVDEVIIHVSDAAKASEYITFVNSIGATAHLVLETDSIDAPVKQVQEINGYTVVSASLNSASPRQRIVKRLIDIFFGLIGAAAVIILTVIIGPLIFLEDRGPIFFTQKRVGRNGRVFRIIKFRTMRTDAEELKHELEQQNEMSGNIFKIKNDHRITRIGRFLRRTSIDELPQAFNILMGTMSVVGTRPPTLEEFRKYEPQHKVRLAITPGLTGFWQVNGRSKITDFDEIVRLDEQYIRRWSVALDIRIILKTFVVVLRGDGAE